MYSVNIKYVNLFYFLLKFVIINKNVFKYFVFILIKIKF